MKKYNNNMKKYNEKIKKILNDNKFVEKTKSSLLKVVFGRAGLYVLLVLAQIFIFMAILRHLSIDPSLIFGSSALIAAISLLVILSMDVNPYEKLSWFFLIAAFPTFGIMFFILSRIDIGKKIEESSIMDSEEETNYLHTIDEDLVEELKNEDKEFYNLVKENNLFMVLDPIMGDSGKIYSGLDKNIVEIYKYMADYAHIIIPNLTEARLLTDNKFKKAHDIVNYYENIGKKFIITSVEDGNRHFILAKDKYFIEEDYKFLDKSFGGSGDLFDSIFLANYLKNNDFLLAIKDTRDMIACILDMQIKIDDKANDISINEILKKL